MTSERYEVTVQGARCQHGEPIRVILLGAGGRDFHNFNTFFRGRPAYEVVAFTATQIPFIGNRTYPAELAGPNYPRGIPIYPEEELPRLLSEDRVNQVVFCYSDVSHQELMDKASLVLSKGANFVFLGPDETMLESRVPVLSVCAVRTGCGKSVITRKVAGLLKKRGIKVSVIRHPMAYCAFTPYHSILKHKGRGRRDVHDRREGRVRTSGGDGNYGLRGSGL